MDAMRLLDRDATTYQMTLPEDLVLLASQRGERVFSPGARLGPELRGNRAVLAELSIRGRIDTDLDSLFLLSAAKMGHPVLDRIREEISGESAQHNTQYWIERPAHLWPNRS